MCLYVFFQAEDGIRALYVTGVQTCALPILPLWVRIDNLATGVSSGAGPTAVLNATYARFARQCGFEVDPCRARTGSDKGKAERSVRLFRGGYGDLLRQGWSDLETLQAALDRRSAELMRRHSCPVRGGSAEAAWEAEKP